MTLLVNEIRSDAVYQAIKPNRNRLLGAIRPHLYIKNRPAGTIKVQVTTSDGTLVAESAAQTIASITASNEYHGYVTFYINASLRKDQTYLVKVVCAGYTFDEAGYCGVCNDYDLRKYSPVLAIAHPRLAPLDLEIWSISQK